MNTNDATPMFVDILVNGKKVELEIDTGTYGVFSKKFYDENFRDDAISESDSELKAYGGYSLKPVGKLIDLNFKFNGMTRVLDCFVLSGSGPALIERWWLRQFNLWPLTFLGINTNEIKKLKEEICVIILFKNTISYLVTLPDCIIKAS